MELKNETEIIDGFKRESVKDYIGLWEIIRAVKDKSSNVEDLIPDYTANAR